MSLQLTGMLRFSLRRPCADGKEGDDLAKATQALIALVNTVHTGPPLPIYTTEHASKTASSWNLASSSSDDYYEAARLACQVRRS